MKTIDNLIQIANQFVKTPEILSVNSTNDSSISNNTISPEVIPTNDTTRLQNNN